MLRVLSTMKAKRQLQMIVLLDNHNSAFNSVALFRVIGPNQDLFGIYHDSIQILCLALEFQTR